MYNYVKTWLGLKSDKRAVTALEYGLIACVLLVAVMVGFQRLGGALSSEFMNIGNNHLNAN